MSGIQVLAGVCALMALSSGAARAQARSADLSQPAAASAPLRFDQSLAGSNRLGISAPVSDATAGRDPLAAFRDSGLRHRGPGVALMLVGAAGVVTGLLINEGLITVLGAGVGLVGLYIYLR